MKLFSQLTTWQFSFQINTQNYVYIAKDMYFQEF